MAGPGQQAPTSSGPDYGAENKAANAEAERLMKEDRARRSAAGITQRVTGVSADGVATTEDMVPTASPSKLGLTAVTPAQMAERKARVAKLSNPVAPRGPQITENDLNRAPRPPQQTERANPLTGDPNNVPGGASAPLPAVVPRVDAGRSLGVSTRGSAVPSGQDLDVGQESTPGDVTADEGGDARTSSVFTNPTSKNIHDSYIRKLFGASAPGRRPRPTLTRRVSPGSLA